MPADPPTSVLPDAERDDPTPAPASAVRLRIAGGLGLVGLITLVAVLVLGGGDRLDDAEAERQRLAERTAWSAFLRQSPVALDGDFVAGSLDEEDAVGPQERREDYYAYETADSSLFSIVATAASFTPDLIVTTPDGRRLAASGLRQTRHRAEVAGLRGPGRFVVAVTSREQDARGGYEVSVGALSVRGTLEAGQSLDGELGEGVPRAGRYEALYAVRPGDDDPLILTIASTAFQPRAYLLGPEGEIAEPQGVIEQRDDDDGRHLAVVRFQPSRAVPYTLIVTSEAEGARGPFSLDASAIRVLSIAPDGVPVGGTLGQRGWIRGGRYIDTYRFQAPAGAVIAVEVSASVFAPSVTLLQDKRPLAGGEGRGTVRAEALAEAEGTYEVEVSSTDPGQTGAYTVSVYAGSVGGLLEQYGAERFEALMEALAARVGAAEDADSLAREAGPVEVEEDAVALDPLTGLPIRDDGRALAPPPAPTLPPSARFRPRAFDAGASGAATTRRGHTFEVAVGQVEVRPAGDDRIRVRVRVAERSRDYAGPWGVWANRAQQVVLVDDTGRTYRLVDAQGGNRPDDWARPGDARQGVLVFEASAHGDVPRRLELRYPVDRRATVALPFGLPR